MGDSAEQDALEALQHFAASGRIKYFISAELFREIETTVDHEMRERIRAGASTVEKVGHDHIFYGVHTQDMGYRGSIISPPVSDVVDERMFADLNALGFETNKNEMRGIS